MVSKVQNVIFGQNVLWNLVNTQYDNTNRKEKTRKITNKTKGYFQTIRQFALKK